MKKVKVIKCPDCGSMATLDYWEFYDSSTNELVQTEEGHRNCRSTECLFKE